MSIINKVIGPESKYKTDLPYTYEAKVEFIEGEPDYTSYVADTICGLIANLNNKNINPDNVSIFEIYKEQEKKLDIKYCVSDTKQWLDRDALCESFKHFYEGHIYKGGCTFSDRDGTCT